MTIGALSYIFALACFKPEYCVPAIGWPPMKVKPHSLAILNASAQTFLFVPQQSMTIGRLPM